MEDAYNHCIRDDHEQITTEYCELAEWKFEDIATTSEETVQNYQVEHAQSMNTGSNINTSEAEVCLTSERPTKRNTEVGDKFFHVKGKAGTKMAHVNHSEKTRNYPSGESVVLPNFDKQF